MSEKRFYTIVELAERWSVTVKWVRGKIYDGEIHAAKFGKLVRIAVDEVERYEASRPAA